MLTIPRRDAVKQLLAYIDHAHRQHSGEVVRRVTSALGPELAEWSRGRDLVVVDWADAVATLIEHLFAQLPHLHAGRHAYVVVVLIGLPYMPAVRATRVSGALLLRHEEDMHEFFQSYPSMYFPPMAVN